MVTKKKASLYIPFFFSFSKLFCKGLNINYKYATSLFYFLLILILEINLSTLKTP